VNPISLAVFSRARLAGAGLVIAALTIIALAVLVLQDLEREASLNRGVIRAQQVKDGLDRLRTGLLELRADVRLAAISGDADALNAIEQHAVEVERELEYVRARASADAPLPTFEGLASASRQLVAQSRAIEAARRQGGSLSATPAEEAVRLGTRALASLELSDSAITQRINERTLAQIGVGEGLRKYVAWLLVGSIAVLAGLFIGYRRVQLRERESQRRIERLAHFDTVTGLPNRALLADRLGQEASRSRRNGRPFAVLLFDLDGFKSVNDTWGHAAGDRVLAIVAERSRQCVRSSDTVGRLGGDEFLAILPETTLEGALGVADKLREALSAPYDLEQAQARLSSSVGVSLFPEHGTDPGMLQQRADAALYAAKREGKNRTVVAVRAAAPSLQPTTTT
jgi:diguanylate cyclase (GGDEF)-like protein